MPPTAPLDQSRDLRDADRAAVGFSAAYGRFRMTEFDVAGARLPRSANRLLTILVAGHIYHAGQRLGKTPDDGGTRMIIDSLLSGLVALSLLMGPLRMRKW
jgi:hypothetical protein